MRSPGSRTLLLFLVVLLPAAVLLRWSLIPYDLGPGFHWRPDALEYVAGAQSIVDSGSYYLQVGAGRFQPRYPPGFSMLLAPILALGVDPTGLCRVPALFAGLHAVLLAWITRRVLLVLRGPEATTTATAAGLVAGLGWVLAPISVEVGRMTMSDEPSAFLANLALWLAVVPLLDRDPRPRLGSFAGAGLCWGLLATMRPVEAVLLGAPMLCVAVAVVLEARAGRPTRPLARGAILLGAAALPCLLASLLLLHSGHDPLRYQRYGFWAPGVYDSLGKVFSLSNALHGHPLHAVNGSTPDNLLGNVWIAARVYLGVPTARYHGFGDWWPLAVPLGGGGLAVLLRRRRRSGADVWLLAAPAAVVLAHAVLFSLYYFPSERFHLAAAAWYWPIAAISLALAWSRLPAAFRFVPVLALAAVLLLQVRGLAAFAGPERRDEDPGLVEVRRQLPRWLALDDDERAALPIPFDTVVAQALGLLPRSRADRIGQWGRLETRYRHERALLAHRRVPLELETPPGPLPADTPVPAGARELLAHSCAVDPGDHALVLSALGSDGGDVVRWRLDRHRLHETGHVRIREETQDLVLCDLDPGTALGSGHSSVRRFRAGPHWARFELEDGRTIELRTDGRCLLLRIRAAEDAAAGTALPPALVPRRGQRALRAVPEAAGQELGIFADEDGPLLSLARPPAPEGAGTTRTWLWTVSRSEALLVPGPAPAEVLVRLDDAGATPPPPRLSAIQVRRSGTCLRVGFRSDRPLAYAGILVHPVPEPLALDAAIAVQGPTMTDWSAELRNRVPGVAYLVQPELLDAAGIRGLTRAFVLSADGTLSETAEEIRWKH